MIFYTNLNIVLLMISIVYSFVVGVFFVDFIEGVLKHMAGISELPNLVEDGSRIGRRKFSQICKQE